MKVASFFCAIFLFGCSSSSLDVKKQKYAAYPDTRTFEKALPEVAKAVEEALDRYKIVEKDPEDWNVFEMKRVDEAELETDWVYSKSDEKYVEYKVNGFPRKKYVQVRFRYVVEIEKVIGGTQVKIGLEEQVEKIDSKGNSNGYSDSEEPDSSRANALLEKIRLALLAK